MEFAIVVPLLMALALGIFTGGTAYFRKIAVVDAVREGARYGASLSMDSGVAAWEDSVRRRVVDASGGELALADVCAKLVYATGARDCGVGDPANAAVESTVHLVKVSATTPSTVEFVFFTTRPNLSARLAARYERDTG